MAGDLAMSAADLTRDELARLEAIVERGQQTFVEVGRALAEIRDRRGYRTAGFATFEAYCRERWGWTRQNANFHIQAAAVVGNLSAANDKSICLPSYTQAIQLAPLPPAQQRDLAAQLDFTTASTREVRAIVRQAQAAQAELARRRDAAAAERLEQKRQLASATPTPSLSSALRVFRGDNRQVLPTLETASVQLVITSPGYGIGWDYADGGVADSLPLDEHQANLTEVLGELRRILRCGGVLALNLPETIRTLGERAYPLAAWAQLELRRLGFLLREPLVWAHQDAQGRPLATTTAIGAPSNPYLRRTFERVLPASVDDYAVPNKQQWPSDSYLEWAKDLWPIGPGHARPGGPLAFPDELVRRLVVLFSELGDVVLDPYAGTGVTGRLARELGRAAWLVERESAYWPDLEALQAA